MMASRHWKTTPGSWKLGGGRWRPQALSCWCSGSTLFFTSWRHCWSADWEWWCCLWLPKRQTFVADREKMVATCRISISYCWYVITCLGFRAADIRLLGLDQETEVKHVTKSPNVGQKSRGELWITGWHQHRCGVYPAFTDHFPRSTRWFHPRYSPPWKSGHETIKFP